MAINPNWPQDIANAFVATPDRNGSQAFGPQGDGIVFSKPGPAFIKFVAQAGVTYTVSSDQPISNLIVLGPNGNPIAGGGGITAPNFPEATFSFTPNQTGVYFAEVIGSPAMVATHAVDHILITAQNNQGAVPTTLTGALGPFTINDLNNAVNAAVNIANGHNTVQYYLHNPDGNANGLSVSSNNATVETTPPAPTTLLAPTTPPAVTDPRAPTPNGASVTPHELGKDGKPLTWVGATDAPGKPGDPTQVTVALATSNYPSDQGVSPPFTATLPDQWKPLLQAAEDVWEVVANVKFVNVQDTPDGGGSHTQSPDIRVGLSDLTKYLGQPSQGQFITGDTTYHFTATDKFLPDVTVAIENPSEHGVTALSNGDYEFNGSSATVFQALLHELGHALGLDHNATDKTSIMFANLGAANSLPNDADFASIQALYGAAKPGAVTFSAQEISTLDKLLGITPQTS